MVEIPDSLVERLKRRQTALVSGLGCGELAGAPGWAALVEWLAARVPSEGDRAAAQRLVNAGRIADAVALVRAALGPSALPDAIREAYPDGTLVPDAIGIAAGLPWRAVVTTGFDDMWERALAPSNDRNGNTNGDKTSERDRRKSPHVLMGTDATPPRRNGNGAMLMHLFGRAGQPDTLCLGPGDAHERLTPSGGLAWLDELRRRRSLVMVGFRANDPDLDWLTSWMSVLPSTESPHFLFLDVSRDADPAGEARLVALRTGMNVIPCPGGTAEAVEILAQLSADIGDAVRTFDADVDIEQWLARWANEPNDPEPREVLARADVALRFEQDWERLIELLLGRFDLLDTREEQLATLRDAAVVFRNQLAAPDRAMATGLAALPLAPNDEEVWENLRADATSADAWEELCSEAAEIARGLEGAPGTTRIWREVARATWHELNRPESAVVAYEQSLAAEPGHVETRDELAEILRRLERWKDLVTVLRDGATETGTAAAAKDPVRSAKLLLEAADLLEQRLADGPGAITVLEGVLAIDPESMPAWSALERLYEANERWGDLATLLGSRARRIGPPEGPALRRRRAEILADHLGESDAAAVELELLVASNHEDRAALTLLERIYDKTERVEDHLRVLQRLADGAPDDDERVKLLRRLAEIWRTRPGGLDPAADAIEHILRLHPRDTEAFEALAVVYREARRPVALADLLARQIELTESDQTRIALHVALAETYEQDLDEPGKAYAAYAAAEKLGDQRQTTFEALIRLGERLAMWQASTETLLRWAEVTADEAVRTEVLLQAATLFADQLQDPDRARVQLVRVLAIAPTNVEALTSLARICVGAGDFSRAAELYLEAQGQVPGATEQAELLTTAGKIVHDQLRQENRAAELFAQALALDPEYLPAGERLADMTYARRQWADAEPILDMVARRTDPMDAARAAEVQLRLGITARELGRTEKAEAALFEALRLAPTALPVLAACADFRFQRRAWKEARDLYATILRLHRATLPAPDVLNAMMCIGRCEAELGEAVAAIDWFEKAQAHTPNYRPAIEALAALHESREDWTALVRDKRSLKVISSPDHQARLMEEIGDLYFARLGEVSQGQVAYQAALELDPERRTTLHKMLELHTRQKDWRLAAETLVRLAEVDDDPAVRAKSLFAAALIRRDELGHHTEAADLFERALDASPDMVPAFDALEKLHRSESDWEELARSYRRMIRRLPVEGNVELRLRLWSQLGELAYKRLHNRDVAIAAFEVAASLAPGEVHHQERLADLYVQAGPDTRDKAIAAHQHLIAHNPNRLSSYRALARLYGETGEFDKHWCLAATLSFLHKGDAGLEALYQRHRPPELRLPARRFTEEVWQRVRSPDEDRMVDAIFVLVGAYLAAPAARSHAALGLRRKKRVELATDPHLPVRALVSVGESMDVALPDVFLSESEQDETTLLNLQDKGVLTPGLMLGRSTLRRRDDFELVFDLSKRLAFLRPERFLRSALSTPEALETALHVALTVAGVPFGAPIEREKGEIARLTDYLRKTVAPQTLEQLTLVAPKLVAAHSEGVDFEKWLVATDLSASRAALVMTGDLWAAARVISSEPATQSSLGVKDRLKDLIAYSVSEDYFICRRLIGLDLQ